LDAKGALLRARLPGFDAPARGDSVQVFFDPRCVHVFSDDDEGRRIEVGLEAL
jgi:hypothetical protein